MKALIYLALPLLSAACATADQPTQQLTAAAAAVRAAQEVGAKEVPEAELHLALARELVDARAAYARAESGPARTLEPASLHEAHNALSSAEAAYEDDAESTEARDRAYIAARKAQLAEQLATTRAWQQREQEASAKLEQARTREAASTRSQLESTDEALQRAQEATRMANQRAEAALQQLTAANAVKQEPRGTVITLPGGVLFASGKAELLQGAQEKLLQVADVLKEDERKNILIEGHTDSRGSDENNMALSRRRAEAVRTFFVGQGVPESRVTATGAGETRPIADNDSAEGRANNRRVEIVIETAESE